MSQTGYTPIQLYHSTTAAAAPSAGNLANGELALNITDGKLYYKDNGGAVQVLASKAGNVNVSSFSAGTTGFTPNTATTGAVTLAGTLATTNGGTGLTSFTANGVVYASSSSALTTGSALTFDGTSVLSNTVATGTTPTTPAEIRAATSTSGSGWSTTAPWARFSYYSADTSDSGPKVQIAMDAISSASTGGLSDWVLSTANVTTGTLVERYRVVSDSGNSIWSIGGSEQMRLTSTGLGIGTSSPQSRLEVRQDQSGAITRVIANNNFANTGAGSSFDYYFGTTRLGGLTHAFGASAAYLGFDVWSGSAATQRMVIDSSGNLGLGVTPSAWGLGKAFEVGALGNAVWGGAGYVDLMQNVAYTSGAYRYSTTAAAARYEMQTGTHAWYTAPSGTAGTAISFTQAMTLDASGNLGIGTTSPTERLHLYQAGVNVRERIVADANFSASLTLVSNSRESYVYNYNGDLNLYNNYASGNVIFYTNATERARITSSGNFGIGTSSPGALLHVAGGNIRINDNQGVEWGGGTNFIYGSNSANILVFTTNNTERARITSGGDLLVGTTDAGATTGVGVKTVVSATIPAVFTVFNTAGGGNAYNFYNTNATNNGYRFYVKVDGGIANYQANDLNLSDVRKKTDIQPAGSYLDKICSIPVKTFLYKDQSDTARNLGVIAQDVDAVAPELVDRDGFGETPEGESPYLSIYQTDLQYALMKALQELKAEFDAYKATHP